LFCRFSIFQDGCMIDFEWKIFLVRNFIRKITLMTFLPVQFVIFYVSLLLLTVPSPILPIVAVDSRVKDIKSVLLFPYSHRLTHKSEHSERKIATTTSNIVFGSSSLNLLLWCVSQVSIVHALPYKSTYRFHLPVKLSCPPCLWVADFFWTSLVQ
jgi:hypothetical protein